MENIKKFDINDLNQEEKSRTILYLNDNQENKYIIIQNMLNIFSNVSNKIFFTCDTNIQNKFNHQFTYYNDCNKKQISDLFKTQKERINKYLAKEESEYRILVFMDKFFTKELLHKNHFIRSLFTTNASFGITFIIIHNDISHIPQPLLTNFDYIFLTFTPYNHFDNDKDIVNMNKIYKRFLSDEETKLSFTEFITYLHKHKSLMICNCKPSYELKDTLFYF